jgi:hypothetical protein
MRVVTPASCWGVKRRGEERRKEGRGEEEEYASVGIV